jgi:hypothetical protein
VNIHLFADDDYVATFLRLTRRSVAVDVVVLVDLEMQFEFIGQHSTLS